MTPDEIATLRAENERLRKGIQDAISQAAVLERFVQSHAEIHHGHGRELFRRCGDLSCWLDYIINSTPEQRAEDLADGSVIPAKTEL